MLRQLLQVLRIIQYMSLTQKIIIPARCDEKKNGTSSVQLYFAFINDRKHNYKRRSKL